MVFYYLGIMNGKKIRESNINRSQGIIVYYYIKS